jgi:hypothetical protein
MKKFRIFGVLILLSMMFLINGCAKKDKLTTNCSSLANAVTNSLNAFSANPNTSTCEAYVSAMHDYVNGCSTLTPAEKESINTSLANTNCSGL